MNNFIVKVSKNNRMVLPEHTYIGNDGENLQYNLEFRFIDGFVDGVARLEYQIEEEKYFLTLNKTNNSYTIPIKNVITKEGNIPFQLVITESETEDGIPLYKSDIFTLYCKESLNAVGEAPDGYELWIDEANQKLMQIDEKIEEVNQAIIETDNLNITISKSEGTTTITLTKKDGSKEIVKVYDGETGNGIESITKTGTSGLVDTYTITYTDGTTTTFDVTNGEDGTDGKGIVSITKTSTVGYVDTYTITYTDGTTTTFDVTNGEVTQAQLDETNAEVERAMMVYNALPKVTDTNTDITLNGTANTPMQLELNPSELTQETTTGKNIFNPVAFATSMSPNIEVTNATYSGQDVLYINPLNGTKTTYSITCEANTQYVLSLKIAPALGTGSAAFYIEYGDGTSDYKGISNLESALTQISYTSTANKTVTGISFQGFAVSSNKYYFKDLMLRKSSTTDTYEPYTGGIPQPNPDYPSEVQVIKGNNSILIHGRNIFNKNNFTKYNAYLDVAGSWLYSSTSASLRVAVQPNTTYTISTNNSSETIFRVALTTSESTPTSQGGVLTETQIRKENTNTPITITTNANTKYLIVQFSNAQFDNSINLLQVEFGDTAKQYQEYQGEQVLPLNLPNGMEYCKIGTYEDEFEHDGNKWYLNKYVGKVVFNGSEIWSSLNTTNYWFRFRGTNVITNASTYSNYFNTGSYQGVSLSYPSVGVSDGNWIYIRYNTQEILTQYGITDTASLQSWLSTHNTTVYYVLATPTHEEITDTTLISQLNAIEQAVSYDEQTNISQTNTGLPFRIKASAIRSLVNIFNTINGGE